MQLDLAVHGFVGMLQGLLTGFQGITGHLLGGDITQVNQQIELAGLLQHGGVQSHHAGNAVFHHQRHIGIDHPAAHPHAAEYPVPLLRVQPMAQFHRTAAQGFVTRVARHEQPFAVDLDEHPVAHTRQSDRFGAAFKDGLEHR